MRAIVHNGDQRINAADMESRLCACVTSLQVREVLGGEREIVPLPKAAPADGPPPVNPPPASRKPRK